MNTPTAKQTALASKIFNSIVATSQRHGCPISRKTYQEDMAWLEMNADSRKDVSEYISMHLTAKHDAAVYIKGRVA